MVPAAMLTKSTVDMLVTFSSTHTQAYNCFKHVCPRGVWNHLLSHPRSRCPLWEALTLKRGLWPLCRPLTRPGASRSTATCLPAVRPSHLLFPPQLRVPGDILATQEGPPHCLLHIWLLSPRLRALIRWYHSPPPRPCLLRHPAILPSQAVKCALLCSFSSRGLSCTIILPTMLPVKPNTY